jgi:hypothetical protein
MTNKERHKQQKGHYEKVKALKVRAAKGEKLSFKERNFLNMNTK